MPPRWRVCRRKGRERPSSFFYYTDGCPPRCQACWMALPAIAKYLDPRSESVAAANPIADAVNIPLDELKYRMHELPVRSEEILVIGPSDVRSDTVRFLRDGGRR